MDVRVIIEPLHRRRSVYLYYVQMTETCALLQANGSIPSPTVVVNVGGRRARLSVDMVVLPAISHTDYLIRLYYPSSIRFFARYSQKEVSTSQEEAILWMVIIRLLYFKFLQLFSSILAVLGMHAVILGLDECAVEPIC